MRYKAIIADDEKKICELIEFLGKWEELSIDIVDICYDGASALQSIIRHQPDIVLTDIRMPIYDGFKLMELARNNAIDAMFVIISGYRHFEYAHNAIKSGVADYLLKPINEEQLNSTLSKICQKIEQKRTEAHNNQKASEILELSQKQRTRELFQAAIHNSFSCSSVETLNGVYHMDFTDGSFRVVLINTNYAPLHQDNTIFEEKLGELLNKHVSDGVRFILSPCEEGVFGILNYPAGQETAVRELLESLPRNIGALSEIYGDFRFVVGISNAYNSVSMLPEAFREAVAAARDKLFSKSDLIYFSSLHYIITSLPKDVSLLINSELSTVIGALRADDAQGVIEKCMNVIIRSGRAVSPSVFYDFRDSLLALAAERFEKNHAELYSAFRNDILMKTDRITDADGFAESLKNETGLFLEHIREYLTRREEAPIFAAKQYLHAHFAEPISMEEVADLVSLSPSHFSKVFKESTGDNFSDYLCGIRIDQAKKLLCTSSLKIAEISEMVGYPDEKYFCRLFKKKTSLKPSEYRKLYV